MARAAIREELDGVEQARLFLDLVDDDQACAVIEAPNGIGGEAETLVGVVEREVRRRGHARRGKEVTDERCLARLACPGQDGDRAGSDASPKEIHQAPGMESHGRNICSDAAIFQGDIAVRLTRFA